MRILLAFGLVLATAILFNITADASFNLDPTEANTTISFANDASYVAETGDCDKGDRGKGGFGKGKGGKGKGGFGKGRGGFGKGKGKPNDEE